MPVNQWSRKTSAASTVSVKTVDGAAAGCPAGNSPVNERNRKISSTSVGSVASTVRSIKSPGGGGGGVKGNAAPVKRVPSAPTGTVVDPDKLSPASAAAKSPQLQTSKSAGPTSVPTESLASGKTLSPIVSKSIATATASTKGQAGPSTSVPPSPSLSVPPALPYSVKSENGAVVMKDGEEKVVLKDEQVGAERGGREEGRRPGDAQPDISSISKEDRNRSSVTSRSRNRTPIPPAHLHSGLW